MFSLKNILVSLSRRRTMDQFRRVKIGSTGRLLSPCRRGNFFLRLRGKGVSISAFYHGLYRRANGRLSCSRVGCT